MFTLRVGNIMSGEEAHITLEMAMPLEVDDGEVTYQFPLVVVPRYIPGIPLDGDSVGDGVVPDTDEVSDASPITPPVLLPDFPNPVQLAFTVEIDPCGATLHDLRCSLHKNATLTESNGIYRIELQPGERLNRDFILRYRVVEERLKAFAILSPDEHDPEAGTLMTVITAPRVDTTLTTPRDIVVVLDRSGSMNGWKMECARRATTRIIESFHSQDRFALVVFNDGVKVYKPTLETVGIDEAVNEALLKLLAERTGGSCALVESEERLDEALDDIRLRLGAPALTDFSVPPVDGGNLAFFSVLPLTGQPSPYVSVPPVGGEPCFLLGSPR